jgi:NOL1/NOP2/fmu family ribosome biogenesis protein
MDTLKILNKKETEDIIALVQDQWGAEIQLDYGVLKNNEEKIYIASKDVFTLPLDSLRINSIGMYFGEIIKGNQIRVSIEGSQLIGPTATKNVVELDDKNARDWLRGEDIEIELEAKGFVIIKHKKDFLGSGKSMGNKILNYVPKARRVTSKD